MDKVQAYLDLPWPYIKDFAFITWSKSEDALVYQQGETFILRQPLAQFIDGFGAQRELIHFGYILHLLDIFLKEKTHRPNICNVLRHLMKQPGVSYRNAGLLAAQLIPKVPAVPHFKLAGEVYERLSSPLQMLFNNVPASGQVDTTSITEIYYRPELPTLPPLEFENIVCQELKRFTEAEIKHWLRSGEGPIHNAPHLPIMQSSSWEENLLGRERLRGVAPFLTPLLSALSLPPRRLFNNDLPLGGYADVTNRGRIDALLPTQFALDRDDFIRRFAEQELLYFRREDPVVMPEADLLILLDQGIRTWGNSRLRLTAAALALISQAQAHERQVFLTTSNAFNHLLDVMNLPPREFAELLEASDLTAHPSVALSMLAVHTTERTFDVVLLTHPRNLIEQTVVAACHAFNSSSRLFALTVDEESNATWGQIKQGQLTKAQCFHIQAVEPPASKVSRKQSVGHAARQLTWSGPVESCASPFKVPQRYKVVDVDFDTEDQWMFVLDTAGRVMAYGLDQPDHGFLLPRIKHHGNEEISFKGLVGVPNGFVAYAQSSDDTVFLAHFCMTVQNVQTTTSVAQTYFQMNWQGVISTASSTEPYLPQKTRQLFKGNYYPHQHQVVIYDHDGFPLLAYSIHNNIAQMINDEASVMKMVKMSEGCLRWPELWIKARFSHDMSTGTITLKDVDGQSLSNTPLSDGKPAHLQESVKEVQICDNTLCLFMESTKISSKRLYVYQIPSFHRIAQWYDVTEFKLSPSGRYLARRIHDFCVQVDDLHSNNRLVLRTRSGNKVRVRQMLASHGWLYVQYASRSSNYFFDWRSEELQFTYRQDYPQDPKQPPNQSTTISLSGNSTSKDSKAFLSEITFEHRIVADEVGHIWIYDLAANLVCIFLRDQTDIAGWMPDGTVFGPPRLIGTTSTPNAMRLFAQALRSSAVRQP